MKHIVEISDDYNHSFKVALYLPAKLKDALYWNSESYWHVLDDGYIALHSGRCHAGKSKTYEDWDMLLVHLISEDEVNKKSVISFYNMFFVNEKVRSSGTGTLYYFGTKMKTGPIDWVIIK
jgi:hypothetical protein